MNAEFKHGFRYNPIMLFEGRFTGYSYLTIDTGPRSNLLTANVKKWGLNDIHVEMIDVKGHLFIKAKLEEFENAKGYFGNGSQYKGLTNIKSLCEFSASDELLNDPQWLSKTFIPFIKRSSGVEALAIAMSEPANSGSGDNRCAEHKMLIKKWGFIEKWLNYDGVDELGGNNHYMLYKLIRNK